MERTSTNSSRTLPKSKEERFWFKKVNLENCYSVLSVLIERLDIQKFGAYCMRDTPVPMSNTAVKSHYAGSSWGLPPVRYGRCQAKRSDCEAAFIGD